MEFEESEEEMDAWLARLGEEMNNRKRGASSPAKNSRQKRVSNLV